MDKQREEKLEGDEELSEKEVEEGSEREEVEDPAHSEVLEGEEEQVSEKEPETFSDFAKQASKLPVDDSVGAEFGPIKRPPRFEETGPQEEGEVKPKVEYSFGAAPKKSNKKTIILIIVLLLTIIGGFLLLRGNKSVQNLISSPTPTPAPTSTPSPTEVPKTLEKSQWSLEVLNGSGKSGFAKQIADSIKELGYPVVKVGNADNQNYEKTQILVKQELKDSVELLIADLKDIIKIASYGGELNEGTASARIIIGKDAI